MSRQVTAKSHPMDALSNLDLGILRPGRHFKVFVTVLGAVPELRGPMPSGRAGAMGGCVWSARVIAVHVL